MAETALETQADEAQNAFEMLTGTQKCAILMLLLGEDEASEILKNLSPREVQQLGTAMYSVADVNQSSGRPPRSSAACGSSLWRSSA